MNKTYTEKYVPYTYKLYIDNDTREIYSYNGTSYEICSMVEYATPEKAGVAKLYNSLGNAKDGSITQDCATKNFNKKRLIFVSLISFTCVLYSGFFCLSSSNTRFVIKFSFTFFRRNSVSC